jgi:outer membrane protein OmpA-like peptidoglycan-associated protein
MALKPGAKIVLILVGVSGALFGVKHLMYTGVIPRPDALKTLVPLKTEAVSGRETEVGEVKALPLPSTAVTHVSGPHINYEVWRWNAEMGLNYANGGPETTRGSFMEKHGVNLSLRLQDDGNQNQADLITFAQALAAGDPNPQVGAHFVTDMGDDGAQFFAAVNPQLEKLGKEYRAEVVGGVGYSSGEDGLWGLPEWKENPQSARGALIVGVLRAGDWNDAMDWAAQNNVPNNPDDKVYDPGALNWVNAETFTKASEMYVQGFCEDLPLKGKPNGPKDHHVCVNGVVTWTPGDVTLALRRGGLVPILTTRQNRYQMPCSVIGIHKWNQAHRAIVENLLAAAFEAADQIKTNPAALQRAGLASWEIYKHDQTPEYWVKYYKGTEEPDKQGITVQLGGSRVANLPDNLALFGLDGGSSIMAATYNHYGKIVVQQYPTLVPSYPPASEVIDTSYVLGAKNRITSPEVPLESVSYANKPMADIVGKRDYSIQFRTGSAEILPDSFPVLDDIANRVLVSADAVAIHGHCDNSGTTAMNMVLSKERADSVKAYLEKAGSFSAGRVRTYAHGSDQPIASNDTPDGRAKNRRVQIVLGTVAN